jgi:hypothetical protein
MTMKPSWNMRKYVIHVPAQNRAANIQGKRD